ncbi:MliC family protein [Ruegeria sp. R13_0]|uniref:MliC family protein n=1 Tax=Ruegeria sp. R13_0 TaxID=2821099 RepID=UPI001ADC086E|nr:MliC family protein [Ruegeria sp. R13_0]MBO9436622.1 MliC family protein [Ruegeria sp. R13_0]
MKQACGLICGAVALVCASKAMAEIDILTVTFNCENGIPLPVTYFNASDGSGAAATMVDNSLVAMRQVESGSGIRYESVDTNGTYILRSKGWNATVSFLATNAASEQVIFQDCSSR